MGVTSLLLVSCLSLTIIAQVLACSPPPAILDGSYSPISSNYIEDDIVQYRCNNGFALRGSKTRTCSSSGTFEPAAPTCVSVECKDPVIANGEWTGGSRPPHKYQSSVTYRCKEGYNMEGSPNLICGINSQWLPGLPKCQPVTCNPPPQVVNGTYSPNKASYQYRDVIQYSCLTQDFILSGSNERTCSLDGTFKPGPPACVLVECKDPKVENAEQTEGSPPYRLHNTVTFKCKTGYEMIGAASMRCLKSNEWTAAPTCKKLPPTTTKTATTTPTTTATTTTTTIITPPKDDASCPTSCIIIILVSATSLWVHY